jgi:hypothetical protein
MLENTRTSRSEAVGGVDKPRVVCMVTTTAASQMNALARPIIKRIFEYIDDLRCALAVGSETLC